MYWQTLKLKLYTYNRMLCQKLGLKHLLFISKQLIITCVVDYSKTMKGKNYLPKIGLEKYIFIVTANLKNINYTQDV